MTISSGETVLIIGAGIVGIACAHFLSKEGYKVTVIDKGTIAGGCSHGNCGHILPSHILPLNAPSALKTGLGSLFNPQAPLRIRPRLDPGFLNWLWQFSRRCFGSHTSYAAKNLSQLLSSSCEAYDALIREGGFTCDWNRAGLLYLFKSDRALNAFCKTHNRLSAEYDLRAQEVTNTDIQTQYPSLTDDLAGGIFYAQDASLRPDMLARKWSGYLMSKGVRFFEHCEFDSLGRQAGTVRKIRTSRGEFTADHVVLAAGAMSRKFAREFDCRIPVEPGKGYSVTFKRPEGHMDTAIVLPEQSLAITSFRDEMRLGSMMEFSGYDDSLPEGRVAQLRACAQPYFTDAFESADLERWCGWRPMTWDSLPIIGRMPNIDNAYLATGHNMIGLMSAPATGRLIAEIISERQPHIDCAAFAPTRFN